MKNMITKSKGVTAIALSILPVSLPRQVHFSKLRSSVLSIVAERLEGLAGGESSKDA